MMASFKTLFTSESYIGGQFQDGNVISDGSIIIGRMFDRLRDVDHHVTSRGAAR